MSSGKFIPAMMQKSSVQMQKIRQEQYKSTYKHFQKTANNKINDLFVKTEKELSEKSVMKILTGKILNTKKYKVERASAK